MSHKFYGIPDDVVKDAAQATGQSEEYAAKNLHINRLMKEAAERVDAELRLPADLYDWHMARGYGDMGGWCGREVRLLKEGK